MKNRALRIIALSGVAGLLAIALGGFSFIHQRYFNGDTTGITLVDDPKGKSDYTGDGITLTQIDGMTFDVSAALKKGDSITNVTLAGIDLGLMIPTTPEAIRGHKDLEKWFLSEREFNRQRVGFAPDSPHIQLEKGSELDGKEISVNLTNNCLGSGRWEFTVFSEENGEKERLYQGFFSFPIQRYRELFEVANQTSYWNHAKSMEGWPGFNFLKGMPFDLETLRKVDSEYEVTARSLDDESILTKSEQETKANLIVYNDAGRQPQTWQEMRQAQVQFQSFVPPGIYDESRLWDTNYSEIANFSGATVRQVTSKITNQPLHEIELTFQNSKGQIRRLIVSGLNLQDVPQLPNDKYYEGIYRPMGFGTPFTQDYEKLKRNVPSKSPFFSILLDENNQVMNYRGDVGINGLVIYRDIDNPKLVHIHPLSYERITLVGHYLVDLSDRDAVFSLAN
jgi:hypothetical protein